MAIGASRPARGSRGKGPRTDAAEAPVTPVRLHCLAGGEAPPQLGADLLCLARLSPAALQGFWQVLGPSLANVITKETEQLLEAFCATHAASADELGRAVRACRFVVREGAVRDVPRMAIAEDLQRLCPRHPIVGELLVAGYDAAKATLRREIVAAALVDHGKLLVDVKWRLDAVQASERGAKLQTAVALVTLHFREGTEDGRVTLQVLPDMVEQLRLACEQIRS